MVIEGDIDGGANGGTNNGAHGGVTEVNIIIDGGVPLV